MGVVCFVSAGVVYLFVSLGVACFLFSAGIVCFVSVGVVYVLYVFIGVVCFVSVGVVYFLFSAGVVYVLFVSACVVCFLFSTGVVCFLFISTGVVSVSVGVVCFVSAGVVCLVVSARIGCFLFSAGPICFLFSASVVCFLFSASVASFHSFLWISSLLCICGRRLYSFLRTLANFYFLRASSDCRESRNVQNSISDFIFYHNPRNISYVFPGRGSKSEGAKVFFLLSNGFASSQDC